MPLRTIATALRNAEACIDAGDVNGMKFFINQMHATMEAEFPASGQAAHLASVINAKHNARREQRA